MTVVFPSKVFAGSGLEYVEAEAVTSGRFRMLLVMSTKPFARTSAACVSSPRTPSPIRAVTVFSS